MSTIALPISGIKILTAGVQVLSDKTAGEAIVAGQWLYESAAGVLSVADASTAEKAAVSGFALVDADNTKPVLYIPSDKVVVSGFAGLTENVKLILASDENPGQMVTSLADLDTDDIVTYLGTVEEGSTTDFKTKIEKTGNAAA